MIELHTGEVKKEEEIIINRFLLFFEETQTTDSIVKFINFNPRVQIEVSLTNRQILIIN